MRKVLLAALLILLPGMGDAFAQSCNGCAIGYMPPGGLSALTSSGTAITSTLPLLLPDGSNAAPALAFTSQTNTGINYGGSIINFVQGGVVRGGVSSSGIFAAGYGITAATVPLSGGIALTNGAITWNTSDAADIGSATVLARSLFLTRSIQGSKSKALTDNTATAFVRLAVADDDYEGCGVIYTAYAEDTATDARQTRTGRIHAAILNNSGTETVAFSTGDSAVSVTAGTFTCTFDGNSASADTIDLRATCDTSLAATTTLTFEYRLDCPSTVTVTPQ